jgi:hypothetical protein
MDNEKAKTILQRQIEEIQSLREKPKFSPEFNKWKRDTEIAIQKIFGSNTRHLTDFRNISFSLGVYYSGMPEWKNEKAYADGFDNSRLVLQSMIEEMDEYGTNDSSGRETDSTLILNRLCNRFHLIVRQLRSRHDNRPTLDVDDEYDVQDLMHALLILNFDDIRPEEWTPSYAGSSSRMDFLLKQEQIVIEVKKTRKNLGARELGDQLLIDIGRYQSHPGCKYLVCFVYDPEGRITNPRGIEKDLSKQHGDLKVIVTITPNGT